MKNIIKILLFVMFVTPLSATMTLEDSIRMYKGNEDILEIEKLISKNIDAKNKEGYTALLLAIIGEYPEIVIALIEAGANPNTTFSIKLNTGWSKGLTALVLTSGGRDTEIAKMLIEAGANGNSTFTINYNGFNIKNGNALIIALMDENNTVAKMLIEAGANTDSIFSIKINEYTFKGTALDYALESENTEIIKILKSMSTTE